jgi:starch synthase
MRVLFVTPECAPLAKAGGLGDVSAALPAALRGLGLDVRVLLPGYSEVLARIGFDCRVLEAHNFLVIECAGLYEREGTPYQDPSGHDWPDNPLRFGLLSRIAARLAEHADVIHLNDWPTALVPYYTDAPTLLTVHNLAFQGNFDASWLARLELPPAAFSPQELEFHGLLSFLKGGLVRAGAITTVSPTYALEIQSQELGCGLDGLIRHRRGVLSGILNGIDAGLWNPATDPHLAERYDADNLERKKKNKTALQRRFNLEIRDDMPLAGFVGRVTQQKGVDLIAAVAAEIAATPAQLAILGRGERGLEGALAAAAARHPGRIAVAIGFDEELAHLVEGGADFFLMPSRFEPCGLSQMYSQRYGTPPVARATGGLADTIQDGETGFLFERAEAGALAEAVRRACAAWREPRRWREMQRAGMRRDFSWVAAARRYADLYPRLARGLPPPR